MTITTIILSALALVGVTVFAAITVLIVISVLLSRGME